MVEVFDGPRLKCLLSPIVHGAVLVLVFLPFGGAASNLNILTCFETAIWKMSSVGTFYFIYFAPKRREPSWGLMGMDRIDKA